MLASISTALLTFSSKFDSLTSRQYVVVTNAIETIILVVALGFVELKLIPMPDMVKVVVMTITLVPLAIFSAMGVDGDSLIQFLGRILKHLFKRKKLHFKRVDVKNEEK